MNARLLLGVCVLIAVLPAKGQEGPVIQEGQVDASKIVDALAPHKPIRTRSLQIMREDTDSPGGASQPGKVSLLITFDTNSANLTSSAKQSLDVVGQALSSEKLASSRFAIEGHADPRGGAAANLKLSEQRAQSVRNYLVQNMNIDASRLEAVGKGDHEQMNKANPLAPENRRVTIVNLSR
jgi:outer membrane protein OmpA-like peptidoglycan-associated protein